jgi:hypothetical protein
MVATSTLWLVSPLSRNRVMLSWIAEALSGFLSPIPANGPEICQNPPDELGCHAGA